MLLFVCILTVNFCFRRVLLENNEMRYGRKALPPGENPEGSAFFIPPKRLQNEPEMNLKMNLKSPELASCTSNEPQLFLFNFIRLCQTWLKEKTPEPLRL